MAENQIQLFEDRRIRTSWSDKEQKWYFSIVDVVAALTDNDYDSARKYWKVLKGRLADEGGDELVTTCYQLKMVSPKDGKRYNTDVADAEQVFRVIQSIPSPKAEPFKQWMAHVAAMRVEQAQDPELSIKQAMDDYRRLGYSESWINQRLKSIEYRKGLTDEWKRGGVKEGREYASLTDIMTATWSGLHVREYKDFKGIGKTKRNLRDNMTNTELVLNSLAEVAATELSKKENPKGYAANRSVAVRGSGVAKDARRNLERQLGHSVISSQNADEIRLQAKEEDKALPKP